MNENCLIAEFKNSRDFKTAIEVLEKARFSRDEVSTVVHAEDDRLTELDAANDRSADAPPAEKTTAAATVAGGTLGAALGAMTLVGPLLVAGPLVGMAAGAVGGSMLTTAKRWGVDNEIAEGYESRVREGSMLILVTGDDKRLTQAKRALKTVGPTSLERFPR